MTPAPTHFCHLGAIGWDHESWVGPFYPEDLPPEWRLAYYNTQFDCVFLPHGLWGHTPPETLAGWRQETLERFRFLLEHPPGPVTDEDRARIAALGEQGLLLGPEENAWLVWFDAATGLKALAERLQEKGAAAARAGREIHALSLDADLGRLGEVRTLLEVLGY